MFAVQNLSHFICCVKYKTTTVCKRITGGGGGGGYMLNSKNNVNWYLSNEKNTFADNSRFEPTIIFFENFSGHFHGQSFIKTVQGPSIKHEHSCKILYMSFMENFNTFCITHFCFNKSYRLFESL